MDAGRIICEAIHVDIILRTLDEAVVETGGMGGTGTDAKFVVRIFGKAGAVRAVDEAWCTEYVAASMKPIPSHGGHVFRKSG